MFNHYHPTLHRPFYPRPRSDPYGASQFQPPSYYSPPYDPYFHASHDDPRLDAAMYRDLAVEHQQQARIALALAEEREHQENQYRQRQTAISRLRRELAELEGREETERQVNRLADPYQANLGQGTANGSSAFRGNGHPVEPEPELHSVGQREPFSLESLLVQMLQAVDKPAPQKATPQQRPSAPTLRGYEGGHRPIKPEGHPSRPTAEPAPAPVTENSAPSTTRGDLATRIRGALNETRTEEEKDAIIRALAFVGREQKPSHPDPISGIASPEDTALSKPAQTANRITLLAAIDAIQESFDALKSSFTFPSYRLDFAASTTATQPKLAYTSSNATVNAYEAGLTKLLTQLDGIESGGVESVRGARKALVLAVEDELEALEEKKREHWVSNQSLNQITKRSTPRTAVEGMRVELDAPKEAEAVREVDIQAADSLPANQTGTLSTSITSHAVEEAVEGAEAPGIEIDPIADGIEIAAAAVEVSASEPAEPHVAAVTLGSPADLRSSAALPPTASPKPHHKVEIEEIVDEDN